MVEFVVFLKSCLSKAYKSNNVFYLNHFSSISFQMFSFSCQIIHLTCKYQPLIFFKFYYDQLWMITKILFVESFIKPLTNLADFSKTLNF